MTSQAVYCLSLQIRPTAEEGNATAGAANGGNEQQQLGGKSVATATGTATMVSNASTMVTTSGATLLSGLEKSGVTISAEASRALQTHALQIAHSQIVTSSQSPATVTVATSQQQQQQQHSNIILVRGSRSENGQIILQNTHELLSLLSDEDKPIFLQHQRLTTTSTGATITKAHTTKTLAEATAGTGGASTILFQPAIKSGTLEGISGVGGGGSTILLQSDALKKGTTLEVGTSSATGSTGGPIFLQQRLSKNGTEGPILLRTLKRLDKSQSILVIRNATTAGTVATAGSTMVAASAATSGGISVSTAGGATLAKVKPISTPTTTVVTVTAAPVGAGNVGGAIARRVQEEAEEKKEPTVVAKVVHKTNNMPLGTDGEPIKLPDNLESLPRADHFPTQRHRWNTNEEIAAILISFDKHSEWQSKEVKTRPKSGSMLLYSRKKVRYRRDGYCWKKRKDGKTTREDHMKLKVQGTECIYGCYVHSAILPTFHRRCYWLLQNPDIVLVHYLNVPYPDDNKMAVITPNLALWGDKKEWTKEELVSQLKPMFFPTVFSEDEPDTANEIEISTAETVEAIVSQLMEKQRMARQTALVKQLECGCPDANCADGKSCSHPMRRISAAKSVQELGKRTDGHGGGTAPNVLIGSRMYPRWLDNRRMATGRVEQQQQQQQQQQQSQQPHPQHTILDPNGARAITPKTLDSSIHFQVIPTSAQSLTGQNSIRPGNQNPSGLVSLSGSNSSSQLTSVSSHITNGIGGGSQGNHLGGHRSAMIITTNQHQQQQQQQQQHHQQQHPHHHPQQQHPNVHTHHGHPQHAQQQHTLTMNGSSNSSSSSNSTNSNNTGNTNGSNQLTAIGHSNQVTPSNGNGAGTGTDRSNTVNGVPAGARDTNINLNGSNENHISMIGSTGQSNRPSNTLGANQRSGAAADGSCGDTNVANGSGLMSNGSNNGQGGQSATVHHNRITINGNSASVATSTPPLVLSLGQNLGAPGSLLILNGQQQSYVCQSQHQKSNDKEPDATIKTEASSSSIAKQEMMDASSSPVPSLTHHQTRQSSQPSSSSPSSTTTGGTSEKQSFESIFGYQDHTPMASPVQSMENSGPTHHHDNLPFFNETLDLSQEDIQKTLSANMPLGGHVTGHDSTPTDDAMNGEINPMDFIENCGDVNHGTVDDDVFVNLDAFDMLVEFPELELDAKNEFLRDSTNDDGTGDTSGGGELAGDSGSELGQYKHHVQNEQQQPQQSQPITNASTITDFSPEWAYPEGGIKVLVTGPWSASSAYTVLFDSFPVPTTLVQDGVLRCYCPAHEVGVVTLQVACDGFVISNAVNFEYKSPPKFETKCEGNGNDMLYKFNLLNRLESIDEKLQIKVEPGELPEDTLLFKQNNFEDRLVNYCETLTAKMWRSVTPGPFIDKHQGMTLLHLAAALGYAKLVRTMLTWKAENSNVILEAEIDALSQDKDGYTPLTLACARGHTETAIILYKWNQNALNVRNHAQKSPVEVARDYGHGELARELERQEKERLHIQQRTPTSASIPTLASISSSTTASSSTISASSATPNTLPTSCSNHSSSTSSPAASPAQKATGHQDGASTAGTQGNRFSGTDLLSNLNESNSSSSNSSNSSSSSAGTDCKPTDSNNNLHSNAGGDMHSLANDASGTMHNFLNLNQIFSYGEGLHGTNSDSCSNDNFGLVAAFNPSLSPTALSPYSEMKGSCSSTGSQSGGLHYGLENTNSNPMLSNALSPNSDSNRSHDGVFLRPGAVYSSQSPPGARLSKRSSIDSGINMDNRSGGLSRTGKTFRDAQRTNRMDRSMSLPLASGGGQPSGKNQPGTPSSTAGGDRETDSFSLSLSERTTESPSQVSSNVSLLSPLRKMDFALCEVSATESSPMCEDADSLQEDDCHLPHHQLPDSMDMGQGSSGNGAGTVTNAVGDSDAKVLTLAEQIIAAMPERIKNESEETMYLGSPLPDSLNEDTSGMGILNDTFMEPLLDSLPSSQFDQEFNFEFSDHNYRYHDVGTPCSSLSPASSGPLQSPASYSIPQDHPVGSPSPPPTTQDFTEFLQSSSGTVRPFEADFSNLKLNDREQRELYEAAKCIQKAYRSYKGRKSRMEEQDKERTAAVVIQNYYRRYKQYAYYRQMTQAALVIQNGYRSYCENKRFKKSQTSQQQQQPVTSSEEDKASAQCLETYYQNFRNEQKQQQSPQQQQQNNQQGGSVSKEPSPSGPLKRTYSQRTQNQAARKIQQFMRQSKNNTWDEQMTNLATERTSRKREAGPPTQGGVPPKLAVSRTARGTAYQRSKVN
ncbi:uncharacterized protein LOC125767566 isoform X1 [Anopheles funestus]|uniref:uncharacterized protein LOC125767566 isoform X1 n=1 Tax=Anopheles funestus TaxID=62324 RepID=UPI0020C60A12|nr:uncharacterized protein LOC125767566 isoform X1 [Anopheles funestus]XP_049290206.1 uncharacterized protein LOC125767566 isoform X1 [Anopheles funestus]XP_049290208.1 uncharacterized protein LOC125767566 isoform X1 [Anopheles funestus]XP_049290209.1 uncharacterized protein LOC125767566 isoform X1 [Anopheles funestus]XP_049290210.1 uncharacterized protein LOC125767566 isoform X1 [Anopheles funestus]XP_049290211.1 uncharacterized protein LOC125767566 isoform X1 [Anopheles funestus]XP_04929021